MRVVLYVSSSCRSEWLIVGDAGLVASGLSDDFSSTSTVPDMLQEMVKINTLYGNIFTYNIFKITSS